MLEHAFNLGAYLFCINIFKLITNQNIIKAFMCLELPVNAVNINLVTFSNYVNTEQLKGKIVSIFVIIIAIVEAVIGLTIVLTIYCNKGSTRINHLNLLKW
jgi:NAD(P)H-quinone oxidoreductase subunit 4L